MIRLALPGLRPDSVDDTTKVAITAYEVQQPAVMVIGFATTRQAAVGHLDAVRGQEPDARVSSASPRATPIPTASLTQTQGFESLLEDSANLKTTDVLVHEFDVGKDI